MRREFQIASAKQGKSPAGMPDFETMRRKAERMRGQYLRQILGGLFRG